MLDLDSLIIDYHIPTGPPERSREGWTQLNCPQCGSSGTHGGFYLGYAKSSGTFNCWRCGKLDYETVLRGLLNVGAEEARRLIFRYKIGRTVERRIVHSRPRTLAAPQGAGPMTKPHRRYLERRKFDPARLEKDWGLIGTTQAGGIWAWRVVAPVRNGNGLIVAYQGRSIGEASPKYRMTEDDKCRCDPKAIVYGLDCATDAVVVVEGVTGVWRLGYGAVATLGIDWKQPQVAKLARFSHRFILFDPEPKAQQRAEGLAQALAQFGGVTEVLSGFSTDPGDFSERKARRVMRELGFT